MPKTPLLHLDLVTPDKRYLTQDVSMVVLPGELGDMGIMAEHAPIISMLRPGMIEVHDDKGGIVKYFVSSGYVNVINNSCTILAESLIPAAQLHAEASKEKIEALKKQLDEAVSEIDRATINRTILEEETKLLLAH